MQRNSHQLVIKRRGGRTGASGISALVSRKWRARKLQNSVSSGGYEILRWFSVSARALARTALRSQKRVRHLVSTTEGRASDASRAAN